MVRPTYLPQKGAVGVYPDEIAPLPVERGPEFTWWENAPYVKKIYIYIYIYDGRMPLMLTRVNSWKIEDCNGESCETWDFAKISLLRFYEIVISLNSPRLR